MKVKLIVGAILWGTIIVIVLDSLGIKNPIVTWQYWMLLIGGNVIMPIAQR